MLVDFTVENFRSIKEPVTLSAVAQRQPVRQGSKSKRVKSDNEITPGFPVEGWNLNLLPVLAIFGANASGKSNLIQALNYLFLVMGRESQEILDSQHIFKYPKLTPFKLDKISATQPTKFELRVALNGNIYTYTLVWKQNQIFLEGLDYTLAATRRTRLLFNRLWDDKNKKYIWKNGSDFKGSHTQLQPNIRQYQTFVSLIFKIIVESDAVNDFILYISSPLVDIHLDLEETNMIYFFKNVYYEDEETEFSKIFEQVVEIIKKFDTGISGVDIQEKIQYPNKYDIYALHEASNGSKIKWLFEEESLGTQRLFILAWRIVQAFETGGLVIIDELGNNIHPNITRAIIKMFQDPKLNPKGAQLIMTSHDNTLQRNNLLRRDQIWFTQKRPDGSTDLYPLTDFHVRNDLAIDKAYLDGRFGAVPFLPADESKILKAQASK